MVCYYVNVENGLLTVCVLLMMVYCVNDGMFIDYREEGDFLLWRTEYELFTCRRCLFTVWSGEWVAYRVEDGLLDNDFFAYCTYMYV